MENGTYMVKGVDTNVFKDSAFTDAMGPIASWKLTNPPTLPTKFPPSLTHISGWLAWAKDESSDFKDLGPFLADLAVKFKANPGSSAIQWIKNMHHHLNSTEDSLRCPICGKYLCRVHLKRHGKSCFSTLKTAGGIYTWVKHKNKFICLICAKLFASCKQLVSHYLLHTEKDVNVLGMTRFLLGRGTPTEASDQAVYIQKMLPDFRLKSRLSTAHSQLEAEQFDFLQFCAQPGLY